MSICFPRDDNRSVALRGLFGTAIAQSAGTVMSCIKGWVDMAGKQKTHEEVSEEIVSWFPNFPLDPLAQSTQQPGQPSTPPSNQNLPPYAYPMNTDNAPGEDCLENVLEVELVRALIATEGRTDSKQERATKIFKHIRKQREAPAPKTPDVP